MPARTTRNAFIVALVLCWPVTALCQSPTQALLDTIHDEESLLAASPFFDKLPRPLDLAALRAALDSENPYLRWFVGMTLVGNGVNPIAPERLVPVLVDAIKHGTPEIRRRAFGTLDSLSFSYTGYDDICAPTIDDDVIAGMRDPDPVIRSYATQALSDCPSLPVSITAREIAEWGERDSRGLYFLITRLSQHGPEAKEAADALITALDDDYYEIRRAAAEALRSAGVDPALYVPRIIDEVRSGERGRPGAAHPIEKLIDVAPDAAQWASEIIDMHQNHPSPDVRGQLRRVLNRIGTPEAQQIAANEEFKESYTRSGPLIGFVAATAGIVALLVVRGWGVLLGFLFPVVPLVAGLFFGNSTWHWLSVLLAGAICSLVGAVAGFLFASGESGGKRSAGRAGGGLSAAAMLLYGFLLVALSYGLAPLGAG